MKILSITRKWKSRLTIFLVALNILWGFSSCVIDENKLERESGDTAYVTTRMGSINLDETYWEDRVVEVRMLVFDRMTGAIVHNDWLRFDQPMGKGVSSEVEELLPGTYDFLFIANESAYEGLTYQLKRVSSLQDFATNDFFSSLVYTQQTTNEQGTIGFKPGTQAPHLFLMTAFYDAVPLVPSSRKQPYSFKDKNGVEGVALVRALTKVSVTLQQGEELSAKRVKAFRLKQVPRQFTLPGGVWRVKPKASDDFFTYTLRNPFTEQDYKNKKVGTVHFYVPERLIASAETPTDLAMQLEIEGEGFETQQVPLRFKSDLYPDIQALDLPVLKEGENEVQLARESVVRNMHTQIKATLTPQDVQFTYEVLPWKYDLYIHDYEPFTAWKSEWVAPRLDQETGATGETTYFVWATQEEPAIYKLNMGKPAGGRWKVTLTNGKDFEFVTTPITAVINGVTSTIQGATEGIAERDYFIVVAPRWKSTFFERKAEFYITVNGKEVDPDVVFDIQQGEGIVVNGPIGTGKGNRYWIKQPSN